METRVIREQCIDPYYIKVDSYKNHSICRDQLNEDGKEHTSLHGYYTSLRHALKEIARLKTIDSMGDVTTIKQYVNTLHEINNQILETIEA